MKVTDVIIVIPSLCLAGPIKGAVAIANGLESEQLRITLISLKGMQTTPEQLGLSRKVNLEDWKSKGWLRKFKCLKEKYNDKTVYISLCFSADLLVSRLPNNYPKIMSIRGNLLQNYCYDYGKWGGYLLSTLHYSLTKSFDHVLVMSNFMRTLLEKKAIKNLQTIYNFIDEAFLNEKKYKAIEKKYTFIYLGGLNSRKKPLLLAQAFSKILKEHPHLTLCYVGDGPLKKDLKEYIISSNLQKQITLFGHLSSPYSVLQESKICVLPSVSEGISRAVLESLFLGIPCILRRKEASPEIITKGKNGALFDSDERLSETMLEALQDYEQLGPGYNNLIPENFRMNFNINKLKKLLTEIGNK